MLVLGTVLTQIGWKWTMIIGVLGHAGRFAVYAYFPDHPWLIIVIQVLHGICYAFFFATVYIFVDEFLPKDARASAQGLFNVMILGFGALIAYAVCPYLRENVYTDAASGVTDFTGMFQVPMYLSLAGAAILLLIFWPPTKAKTVG
jgi:MFS family permease